MKRSIIVLAFLFPLLISIAHAQKGSAPHMLYVTYDPTQVYDSASYLSNVVDTLHAGDSVVVLGSVKKFYRIAINNREGYILADNLASTMPAGHRVSIDPESRSITIDSLTLKLGGDGSGGSSRRSSASQQESQQCKAITKAGKRCSRMTTDPSGYCWQHKKMAP
jgi:hypothetical protein